MTAWQPDGGGGRVDEGLLDRVRQRIVLGSDVPRSIGDSPAWDGPVTYGTVVRALRAEGVIASDEALVELASTLLLEFDGLGRLEPLLRVSGVTDILVNATNGTWADFGAGLEPMPMARFTDEAQVRGLAQRLADSVGRRLDDASPWVDARLPQGLRLHAVIPPLAVDGTLISLRIPARRGLDLIGLQEVGAVDAGGAAWLGALVAARLTFLVSGGTGSGKTTVLGALLSEVESSHRIVIVEDSTELDPAHPHCVRLQARTSNVEGAGAVGLRDLVRQALRMRPDRIVVGEVRGPEVLELLTAFNTGHEGCCGTIHANQAKDVPARLEALALTAGIPRVAVHSLLGAGLDVIIHLRASADPNGIRRRVVEGIHVVEHGVGRGPDREPDSRVIPAVAFGVGGHGFCAGPGYALLAERLRARGVTPPSQVAAA